MIGAILILLCSLGGLWYGTRLTVRNAVRIAARHRVSQLFIGLTIVSIGTGLPELSVTLSGSLHSLQGHETSGMILGNAVGSSFANAALILGITAFFGYLRVTPQQARRDISTLVGALLLLFAIGFNGIINRYEACLCLLAYGWYLYRIYKRETSSPASGEETNASPLLSWLFVILGLGLIILSSEFAVRQVLRITEGLNIGQSVVGLFIVAIGTSLPELAVALRGAAGESPDISVGTILGSNIFNTLFLPAAGSLISPVFAEKNIVRFDIPALILITLLLGLFLIAKRGIQFREGIFLIISYCLYTIIRFLTLGV